MKKKFCWCYSFNTIKVLESPGMLLKVLEYPWNFDVKIPGKGEKKFWNLNQFFWWEPCYDIVTSDKALLINIKLSWVTLTSIT